MTKPEFKKWLETIGARVVSVRSVRTRPGVLRAFLFRWHETADGRGNILEYRIGAPIVRLISTATDREELIGTIQVGAN